MGVDKYETGICYNTLMSELTRYVSFNENALIYFNRDALPGRPEHTYTHKDVRLKSATGFVEKYHEEFDAEAQSQRSGQKWDEDGSEVLAMWQSSGAIAAGFGTALHAVFEHYFTYKTLGARIQEKAGKPKNAAMPNHPFLQQLINDLETIRVDGDTRQEVCISKVDAGVCGLVDDLLIVDAKKKICRIRDYKITADILTSQVKFFEPFTFLEGNKLNKNYLQLCFYAYLMECAGWKVEGIDIFNWNGEWSKYSLERKDMVKIMITIGICLSQA